MIKYVIVSLLAYSTLAYSTWCGKHYELGAPDVPPRPESYFTYPVPSRVPLLDFRCIPASSSYLDGESGSLIIDASLNWDVGTSVESAPGDILHVDIFIDDIHHTSSITVGSMGREIDISLHSLDARIEPHDVRCVAQLGSRQYLSTAELFYLPKKKGSVVKLDRRTGATWVKKGSERWKKQIPFGWYDSIDVAETPVNSWLGGFASSKPTNIQRLESAHSFGFNMIHPVPPGKTYEHNGGSAAIDAYFDRAEDLGIWIMYDMRHDAIEAQVIAFRDRPNLLTWYIADEPDGPPTPPDTTLKIRRLIRRLDPYHPISIALNCYDHYWTEYTAGTDIVLADVYPLMNPVWSKKWSTPVTSTFGASGCDNCSGNFYDLSNRLDIWEERKRVIGRRRDLVTWVVPQAFDDHGEEFWWRVPNGDEGAAQIVLAWNHGVMGHCAWLASSATPDLLQNASLIASHLYAQTPFLIDNAYTRRKVSTTHPYDGKNGVDVAAWSRQIGRRTETLVMAVQMNYISGPIEFGLVGIKGKMKTVLFGEVYQADTIQLRMGRISVAAVIIEEIEDEPSLLSFQYPFSIGQIIHDKI